MLFSRRYPQNGTHADARNQGGGGTWIPNQGLETEEIQIIWENGHQIQKKRNIRGKKTVLLVISNAHRYRGAVG